MGFLTLFLCFVLAVLPSIRSTTPEFFGDIGQPMSTLGQPMRPLGQPMSTLGDPMNTLRDPMSTLGDPMGPVGQSMSNEYGRIWCTCRRRCRYRERTMRYTCMLPEFYPRYWNTCCKYLSSYQTSSFYGGFGESTFPQFPQTYQIPQYGMAMGMGMGMLPPKGAK